MSFIALDREREVRLRNKAIDRIEERFKKPYTTMLAEISSMATKEYIFILFQGMKHEDPQLTLEKVEDLVDEHTTMNKVIEAVTQASYEAYGMTEEDVKEAVEEAKKNGNPNQAAADE